MALLGAQLVITLIMVSVIQKIGNFSFARWLLCSRGLFRYLYPDNNELKTLAGVPREKPKSKKGGKSENGKPETFHVPRSLEIKLETTLVTPEDVVFLRFYSEYQWIVDFSLYSIIVYVLSEVYHAIFPLKDELNLSMVWCLLVILFSFKILLSLTKLYFTSEESIGERSTCIVSFCAFLVIAMIILIVDDSILEVGVDPAYDNFHENASKFLENTGLSSVGPASKLIVKLTLAVWAALIGALFTFPGMRVARMHWDSLQFYSASKLRVLLLNMNFALPFILVVLWVRPVTRDYLTGRVFSGMDKPLMSQQAFETTRLILCLCLFLSRLLAMRGALQAYLDMAERRLTASRKEAGRLTNVQLQKKIASVFYYLCVVALQYICPVLICVFFAIMYKTLGGFTWTGIIYEHVSENVTEIVNSVVENSTEFAEFVESEVVESVGEVVGSVGEVVGSVGEVVGNAGEAVGGVVEKVAEAVASESEAEQFQLALENLKMVFTQEVYRGVFGFATWWCCFAWFLTTGLGLAYQTYFRIS